MSAANIIAEIERLPREEQEVVFAFVRGCQPHASASGEEPSVRYMEPAKAAATATIIFSENAELFRKLAK